MYMEKKLTNASSLKKGSYVLIDDNACVVREVSMSKPGKHGHAKARIVAIDMITGSKKEIVKPGHDNVEVPIIAKQNAQVLSIEGNNVMLMDNESFENLEADLEIADEDVKGKVAIGQVIQYWDIGGKIVIKQIKEDAE